MGEVVWLSPAAMLNQWWKELDRKPFGVKPERIRALVKTAQTAGWTLEECYEALNITWAFTDTAFETALRRCADEKAVSQKSVNASRVDDYQVTRTKLDETVQESLPIEENIKRLQDLRKSLE